MTLRLLALTASIACSAMYCAPVLLTQAITVAIPRDFANQRPPLFENGFVLAYDFDHAKVWSYDRNGNVIVQVQLAIPNTARILIRSIAAAPDGTLAVPATARDGQGNNTSVIFWISPAGAITRVVHTAPFSASQVAFAADGSLWAGGRSLSFNPANPPASRVRRLDAYDVLQHYDAHGELLDIAVPYTSFANGSTVDPSLYAFLRVTQDRIGYLSLSAGEYVELSPDGKVLGHWTIKTGIEPDRVSGFALTPSDSIFISSYQERVDSHKGHPAYQVDKTSGTIQAAEYSMTGASVPAILLGSDGDKLVFHTWPVAVSWFTVQ